MSMSSTSHLTNIPSNEYIMFLYNSDDEHNNMNERKTQY